MKSTRRVLVIARQYWPITSDDTLRLKHWVDDLRDQNVEVCLLTPRWHASWPRRIVCDDVLVERIDYPPTHTLRHGRYQRQIGNWIARNQVGFDLIYCDAPDLEAAAILNHRANDQGPPLIVRYDSQTADGSSTWTGVSGRTLDVCRRAALVLAADATSHQQLLAAGLPPDLIARARQVQGSRFDRNPESRRQARQVLCEINHDLFATSQDRVLICPGELSQSWGIELLIRALAPLIETHRSLRVWIMGDSRLRPKYYEALRHEGLHRAVAMPGIFTDMQSVFQAADLCVFPAARVGLGWLLPTCIASSVPTLVCDSVEARQMLGPEASDLSFAANSPHALRERVANWLVHPSAVQASMHQVHTRTMSADCPTWSSHGLFQRLEINV